MQGLLECLNEVAGHRSDRSPVVGFGWLATAETASHRARGFYAGETMGLDPVKASLTVLQTCAAPASWAQDPLQQLEAQNRRQRRRRRRKGEQREGEGEGDLLHLSCSSQGVLVWIVD